MQVLLVALCVFLFVVPFAITVLVAIVHLGVVIYNNSNAAATIVKLILAMPFLPAAWMITLAGTFNWRKSYGIVIGSWLDDWREVIDHIKSAVEQRRLAKQKANQA